MAPESPQAPDSRWAASWGGTTFDVGKGRGDAGGRCGDRYGACSGTVRRAGLHGLVPQRGEILDGMPGAYTVTMDELFPRVVGATWRGSW